MCGGIIAFVYGNRLTWRTKNHRCIIISSGEAEYVALSDYAREMKALRNFLRTSNNDLPKSKLYCDSTAAIATATTAETRHTRHIDTCFHKSREAIKNNDIMLIEVL